MEDSHRGADPPPTAAPADRPAPAGTANANAVPATARPLALRDHLPGLEAERHVDDWGRSELLEDVLDRGLVGFLYHYWFRVSVEGLENVPSEGPALLVANRAGALRADAAMVAKALRERPVRPRRLRVATERPLGAVPGLDMLVTKAGGVTAHPANLHRLLFDEGELVLAFPEGEAGGPLRDRYRVRPFARGDLLGAALRARAPIVPVAVLGTEEASPIIARLPRPLRGALPVLLPLPAKIRIRFLPPVEADRVPELRRARTARTTAAQPTAAPPISAPPTEAPPTSAPPTAAQSAGSPAPSDPVGVLAAGVRALLQDALLEMVADRRSVWVG